MLSELPRIPANLGKLELDRIPLSEAVCLAAKGNKMRLAGKGGCEIYMILAVIMTVLAPLKNHLFSRLNAYDWGWLNECLSQEFTILQNGINLLLYADYNSSVKFLQHAMLEFSKGKDPAEGIKWLRQVIISATKALSTIKDIDHKLKVYWILIIGHYFLGVYTDSVSNAHLCQIYKNLFAEPLIVAAIKSSTSGGSFFVYVNRRRKKLLTDVREIANTIKRVCGEKDLDIGTPHVYNNLQYLNHDTVWSRYWNPRACPVKIVFGRAYAVDKNGGAYDLVTGKSRMYVNSDSTDLYIYTESGDLYIGKGDEEEKIPTPSKVKIGVQVQSYCQSCYMIPTVDGERLILVRNENPASLSDTITVVSNVGIPHSIFQDAEMIFCVYKTEHEVHQFKKIDWSDDPTNPSISTIHNTNEYIVPSVLGNDLYLSRDSETIMCLTTGKCVYKSSKTFDLLCMLTENIILTTERGDIILTDLKNKKIIRRFSVPCWRAWWMYRQNDTTVILMTISNVFTLSF